MEHITIREIPWFYLDREEPEKEFYLEMECQEEDVWDDGERLQNNYILLPEDGAEELWKAEEPLVIAKGLWQFLYICRPEQWKKLCADLEKVYPGNTLLQKIKMLLFGSARISEVTNGKLCVTGLHVEKPAILLKYRIAGETYYAVKQENKERKKEE